MSGSDTYTPEMADEDDRAAALIIAGLKDENRVKLGAQLDAMDNDPRFGQWIVSEGTSGTADDPHQFPYVSYENTIRDLIALLGEARLSLGFDWPAWSATVDTANLPIDTPTNALKTITTIIRADRFNEGLLLSHLESGRLQAAIRRIIES